MGSEQSVTETIESEVTADYAASTLMKVIKNYAVNTEVKEEITTKQLASQISSNTIDTNSIVSDTDSKVKLNQFTNTKSVIVAAYNLDSIFTSITSPEEKLVAMQVTGMSSSEPTMYSSPKELMKKANPNNTIENEDDLQYALGMGSIIQQLGSSEPYSDVAKERFSKDKEYREENKESESGWKYPEEADTYPTLAKKYDDLESEYSDEYKDENNTITEYASKKIYEEIDSLDNQDTISYAKEFLDKCKDYDRAIAKVYLSLVGFLMILHDYFNPDEGTSYTDAYRRKIDIKYNEYRKTLTDAEAKIKDIEKYSKFSTITSCGNNIITKYCKAKKTLLLPTYNLTVAFCDMQEASVNDMIFAIHGQQTKSIKIINYYKNVYNSSTNIKTEIKNNISNIDSTFASMKQNINITVDQLSENNIQVEEITAIKNSTLNVVQKNSSEVNAFIQLTSDLETLTKQKSEEDDKNKIEITDDKPKEEDGNNQNGENQNKDKKSTNVWVIVGVILGIIVVFGVVAYLYYRNTTRNDGYQSANNTLPSPSMIQYPQQVNTQGMSPTMPPVNSPTMLYPQQVYPPIQGQYPQPYIMTGGIINKSYNNNKYSKYIPI